jgi:glycosyltransferase involved in cell wall biosynthesis
MRFGNLATPIEAPAELAFEHATEPGLVSVVIPTYNRAAEVGNAIDSVLSQTYKPIEVIVVDDGSTDDTAERLKAYGGRIRYFRQANGGVSRARNAALAKTRGEFVAFLDSDDRWLPWKIELQVAALRARPEAGLTWTDMTAVALDGTHKHTRYLHKMYGAYETVDFNTIMVPFTTLRQLSASVPDEWADNVARVGELRDEILLGNLLHTPTVLLRRAWVERTPGFIATWRAGEDYEYYTRICAMGPVIFIDAPSIKYRIGGDDQITAPSMKQIMAVNNLRTVVARLQERGDTLRLAESVVRRHVSWSLEWAGESVFEVGKREEAVRYMARSLLIRPALDRRLAVLAAAALPKGPVDWLRNLRRRVTARNTR